MTDVVSRGIVAARDGASRGWAGEGLRVAEERRPPHGLVRASLPSPRGPLSEHLFAALSRPPHELSPALDVDAAGDDDLQLALYCSYELHYRGWRGVDDEWEWHPSLLALRGRAERRFEADLRAATGAGTGGTGSTGGWPGDIVDELWRLAGDGDGPSLSAWLLRRGTRRHLTELAKLKSAYQLKEADPHTWAIPRLTGEAKAAIVLIQSGEYGDGVGEHMHATLFATTMAALGLSAAENRYLDEIPGFALATTNTISMFALHRRLRGALVGHLALFEMTSTGPMARYAETMTRLGLGSASRRFYDAHVEADEIHQHIAADRMVGGLLRSEPDLAGDVVFGARALCATEARFTREVLTRWEAGGTSLRSPPPAAGPEIAPG